MKSNDKTKHSTPLYLITLSITSSSAYQKNRWLPYSSTDTYVLRYVAYAMVIVEQSGQCTYHTRNAKTTGKGGTRCTHTYALAPTYTHTHSLSHMCGSPVLTIQYLWERGGGHIHVRRKHCTV